MKTPRLKIIRFIRPEPQGEGIDLVPTLGLLYIDDGFFCFTLEPSWKKNLFNSCIPDGKYKTAYYSSQKFGRCLALRNVKRRSGILIHKGNIQKDTTGCILLGSQIGLLDGRYAVLSSTATYIRFMAYMFPYNGLTLTIKTMSEKYRGIRL